MSQSKKRVGASGLALTAAVLLTVTVLFFVTSGFTRAPLSSTPSNTSGSSPQPQQTGFVAYCSSTQTPAGLYPAGAGATAPPGCFPTAQLISVTVSDIYNTANKLSASYSCVFFYNTGSPASFSSLGQGVQISGGTWAQGPGVQASSTGVCAPVNWTPYPGTQVVVKVCIDSSAKCVNNPSGDWTSQKTVAYCPLPSAAPSAPTGVCTPGPGWGSVPYNGLVSTTAATYYSTASILMIAGQNPTGSNSGFNAANPILLDERYQNGTDFTSANTCLVNTGANACDLPTASSQGLFSMTWTLSTGLCSSCTSPTIPSGSGYATTYPVELQSGSLPRGPLQLVLSVEIKATSNADMCSIQSPTLFGVAATTQYKSNSATDVFYLYILNEQALTRIWDPTGAIANPGSLSTSVQLNCGGVYNGSGDVVTITPIVYAYYSLQYTKLTSASTLNPEASVMSQSAVITVKT